MTPTETERDALLKAFSRALATRDLAALYQAVTADFLWSYHDGVSATASLTGAGPIAAHLARQTALFSAQRFHDRVYRHLPDATFMTMRVSETVRDTGEQREQRGIEQYTFRDGKIATNVDARLAGLSDGPKFQMNPENGRP